MSNYLAFDVESHNAGLEYGMAPHEFVRLFQFAWNDGPVEMLTVESAEDLERVQEIVLSADYLVGHNILSFDLPALFGVDSLEPLRLAKEHRVLDTLILA